MRAEACRGGPMRAEACKGGPKRADAGHHSRSARTVPRSGRFPSHRITKHKRTTFRTNDLKMTRINRMACEFVLKRVFRITFG